MAAELGYLRERQDAFAALATDDYAAVPFSDQWFPGMSLLADTATSLDDARRVQVLYELLLPYADRVAGTIRRSASAR
jgi:hypothetical protein